ncbi:MAG: Ig-like domain-containing protein, partial [Eubacterium sp.]|nr:Ig-like domain-containing protein [Eubacterium sp.]
MRRGSLLKRIFATALAATLIFSNGYSTIPIIGSSVVSEVKAETSSASLILRPQALYSGGYEVKSKKVGDDEIKWLEKKDGFATVTDLSSENNFIGSEIKYSQGGQNVLYIDKGTCLECSFDADPNFSYFDAYLTDKDGNQLGGYKKVSSNDTNDDSNFSHATLTDNNTIPGGTYIVTTKSGDFNICVQDDAFITLYYHNNDGEVLTGFILKIVALEKTPDFRIKGQETVVATRKAGFTVEGPEGGAVPGTDGFKWSVDPSVGSFSKTDRDKALFTAADAANGKEGQFSLTTYSGIDKSEESNAIIAIRERNVSKTFDINIAKRVKAASVNFKINSSDENYVEETIDDSVSDEDWEELKNQSDHYYEKEGKRYVKYAKYYLAKKSSYLLSDKFDYLPKDSNDIFKYTSSDSRYVTVNQNGTINGITPGITSITVSPEDENAISDKAYIEVYTQTTRLTPKKEDGSTITSYSMRSTNEIEIDVEEDAEATERIVTSISHKVDGSNVEYNAEVTKHDDVRQLDTEIQWKDDDGNVVLTQTLLNAEEYFSTNVKKYKFTAGNITAKKELSITFSTDRKSGYLENLTDVLTYVSLDLYPQYEGVLSLKSANDTGELWTGESDTVSAIVDSSNVADQIAWAFSENNIDSEGKECLTIDSIDYTNNKAKISAKKKPESGMVDLI